MITAFRLWDMRIFDKWTFCLKLYRNIRICSKVVNFLSKVQTAWVNKSRIMWIGNAKFKLRYHRSDEIHHFGWKNLIVTDSLPKVCCQSILINSSHSMLSPSFSMKSVFFIFFKKFVLAILVRSKNDIKKRILNHVTTPSKPKQPKRRPIPTQDDLKWAKTTNNETYTDTKRAKTTQNKP